ncbi:PREDICTED: uncharacterized protein LOC105454264 [Wasmannia auropunctata]|uniref:uncharacterized protein LOC105454264 n=1 Tax=Wasmannia auropunctata TaxID=64793 RepID=UPI0005EE9D77|nr:PREDICTED: uncharacterized protein LOC105454264 [Wasmannia auropunctata]
MSTPAWRSRSKRQDKDDEDDASPACARGGASRIVRKYMGGRNSRREVRESEKRDCGHSDMFGHEIGRKLHVKTSDTCNSIARRLKPGKMPRNRRPHFRWTS